MKTYHVLVTQEDDWFIGRVLERDGITTQARTLDELVFMVRDAIQLMWNEKNTHLELLVPSQAIIQQERRGARSRSKRTKRTARAA